MFTMILIIAATVAVVASRPQEGHNYDHGHGHGHTSSHSITVHHTYHEPKHQEHREEHHKSKHHEEEHKPKHHEEEHKPKHHEEEHKPKHHEHHQPKHQEHNEKHEPKHHEHKHEHHVSHGHHESHDHHEVHKAISSQQIHRHDVPSKAPAHHVEYYSHPKYEFEYKVEDKHTKDIKSQHESRDGDVVKGYYSLHEPDGTIRVVHYSSDKKSGFNANVERKGHAIHEYHHHH